MVEKQVCFTSLRSIGQSNEAAVMKYPTAVINFLPQCMNEREPSLEHCYYSFGSGVGDESIFPRSRRRLRTIFSSKQIEILENAYIRSKYPNACAKRDISREANLPVERVQVWFQNKRTRDKRFKEDRKGTKNTESEDPEKDTKFQAVQSYSGKSSMETNTDADIFPAISVGEKCFPSPCGTTMGGEKEYTETSKTIQQYSQTTPKQESPSNTIERSCLEYLQSLGHPNMTGISPSFIRYLHQHLRMSPPDSLELMSFQQQPPQKQQQCSLQNYDEECFHDNEAERFDTDSSA